MKIISVTATAVIVMVSGCAFTTGISTGVLPYKDGALTVTAENLQPSKAKALAYKEAMQYCSNLKKEFSYVDSRGEAQQNFTLNFRCN